MCFFNSKKKITVPFGCSQIKSLNTWLSLQHFSINKCIYLTAFFDIGLYPLSFLHQTCPLTGVRDARERVRVPRPFAHFHTALGDAGEEESTGVAWETKQRQQASLWGVQAGSVRALWQGPAQYDGQQQEWRKARCQEAAAATTTTPTTVTTTPARQTTISQQYLTAVRRTF